MKYFLKIQEFFQKIRASSEPVRRFWLIVLTSCSVAVITGFWIIYINVLVEPVNKTAAEAEPVKEAGVAETFAAGVKTAARGGAAFISNALESLRNALQASRTVTVDSEERNFIVEDLEQIPETALP